MLDIKEIMLDMCIQIACNPIQRPLLSVDTVDVLYTVGDTATTTQTAQSTILELLSAGQRFVTPAGLLSGRVFIRGRACIAVGYDNGNDATRLALLTGQGRLVSLRMPTAYVSAQTIRGGAGMTTYQVAEGAPFWIGEAAISYDGEALPIGPTPQRLADLRQREFIFACLVEGFVKAGYSPRREHQLLSNDHSASGSRHDRHCAGAASQIWTTYA